MYRLYKIVVSLSLFILLHGRRKEKRDISDLKRDPVLQTLNHKEEPESRKSRSLSSTLSGKYNVPFNLYKRQADSADELMSFNQQNDLNGMEQQLQRRVDIPLQPPIANPLPVPDNAYNQYQTAGSPLQQKAVDPSLFASNYLPLQNGYTAEKKSYVPSFTQSSPRSYIPNENADSQLSFPIELRKFSPNMKLRGAVPHISEYGETVESIEKARNLYNYKRGFIQSSSNALSNPVWPAFSPTMYSSDIYKRDEIPHPPAQDISTKFITKRSKGSISKKTKRKKKKKNKGKSNAKQQRQYIPQPPMYQQFAPYISNYQPQNPYFMQQNTIQAETYRPEFTAQVQNMDGLETRPIISDKPCADQYQTCTDFAKNDYCTKFPDLMRIQCRRACNFCTPSELAEVDNNATVASNKTVNVVTSATNNTQTAIKSQVNSTKTTNSTSTLKQSNVDSDEDSASGSVDEFSGSGDDSGDGEDAENSGKPLHSSSAKVVRVKADAPATYIRKLSNVSADESPKKNATSKVSVKSNRSTKLGSHTSGSGSESGLESGNSGSASGSGNDGAVHSKKRSILKKGSDTSTVNEVWSNNKKSVDNVAEFSIPLKKKDLPMPQLNIVSMRAKQAESELSDSESGSGSGDASGDEVKKSSITDSRSKVKNFRKNSPSKKEKIKTSAVKHQESKSKKDSSKSLKIVKKDKISAKPKAITKSYHKKSKTPKTQKVTLVRPQKRSKKVRKVIRDKKTKIPQPPELILPASYPRIDLKAIASALAHYEEAALQLAGEYPRTSSNIDITNIQRSEIPHPSFVVNSPPATAPKEIDSNERRRQNIEVAKVLDAEREKKSSIPNYLKLPLDAKHENIGSIDADDIDMVRKRFEIPGVEPTLNDYYAETGKLNPFEEKHKNYKKSKIENEKKRMLEFMREDPYEYLRNMANGASMEPIKDPKANAAFEPDHSYPVFLMKVSPADEKYIPEEAAKRGKIHKVNAEGLPINENPNKAQGQASLHSQKQPETEVPAPPRPAPVNTAPFYQQSQYENRLEPPQVPASQLQSAIPSNVEQMLAPQVENAFAPEENSPSPDRRRSKMLNAFFSVKNSEMAEENDSSGGGSGALATRDYDVGSRRTIWPGGFKK